MNNGHHTKEQIQKAFAYAPKVLMKLREAGVLNPYFEIFSDASGVLVLGKYGQITNGQCWLAENLVFSKRYCMYRKEVSIAFCCGLVTGAEKEEEEMND